jgi:hypothetical protein
MNPVIPRLARLFLIAFAGIVACIVLVQVVWIIPGKRCEEAGNWWDWRDRVCGRPVLISDITGRVIDTPEARAAAKEHAARQKAAAEKAAEKTRP